MIYRNFICNGKNLESFQMSFNSEWVNSCGIHIPWTTTTTQQTNKQPPSPKPKKNNKPLIYEINWINFQAIHPGEKQFF